MIRLFTLIALLTSIQAAHALHRPEEYKRIYLASYPCSGNHWVRYMIEEATGIATSSVYKDPDPPKHLPTPFPWGGYAPNHGYEGKARYPLPGEPVVIKTHFPALRRKQFDNYPCTQVIRVVRHPIDSVYAFCIWREDPVINGDLPPPKRETIKYRIEQWERFQTYWDNKENVLTFYYEQICQDPATHLQLILEAIGYEFTQADIQRAVNKYPPNYTPLKHLHKYTKSDLSLFSKIKNLMKKHGYSTCEPTKSR